MKDYKYTKSEWEHLIDENIIGLNAKRNKTIIFEVSGLLCHLGSETQES